MLLMSDQSNSAWKVVLSNETKNHRVIGECKHHVFGVSCASTDEEGMLPSRDMQPLQHEGQDNSLVADVKVPLEQVEAINIEM